MLVSVQLCITCMAQQNVVSRSNSAAAKPKTTTTTKAKTTTAKTAKSSTSTSKPTNARYVKNGQEFVNALGSNRTIIVTRPIDITDYVPRWPSKDDLIQGYDNLTIKGQNGKVKIYVRDGSVEVMTIRDCYNLKLENLILGHDDVPDCGQGVLYYTSCSDCEIKNCDLYGCGFEGLVCEGCTNFKVNNTVIHDCYASLVILNRCQYMTFTGCTLRDSDIDCGISTDSNCGSIVFSNCTLSDKRREGNGSLFDLDSEITLKNCTVNWSGAKGDTHMVNGYR